MIARMRIALALAFCLAGPVLAQSCPGEGDCHAANGTTGCNDTTCCELICSSDPFCCEVAWDELCADYATEFCKNDSCPGSGACHEANDSPGCDDAGCCQTVCGLDTYCCDVQWDEICAGHAGGLCGPPPEPCVDLDGDGKVGTSDLLKLFVDWDTPGDGTTDLNDDGNVDVGDVVTLLFAWGPCP